MLSPITISKEKFKPSIQSPEIEEFKSELLQLFIKAQAQRDKSYKQFNGMNLVSYVNQNHSLSMGYVGDVEVDDWQANTSTNLIRNKFIAILSFLLEQMIQPEVSAQNGRFVDARSVARDLEEIIKENMSNNKYFQKYLDVLIEAVGQGTVFVDTGYKKRDSNIFMNVVPIHEVYLGNMFIKDIAEQPFVFRRVRMDYFQAKALYGSYKEFDKVNPFESKKATDDEPDYYIFDQSDLVNGEVELLIYQSKEVHPTDKTKDKCYIAILANGVLLTKPKEESPYEHKEYTIVKGVFNPFPDTKFAYGKSLPHEQMFNQEVADTLLNMIIDKTYLSIFRPLMTLGREEVTSDIVVPGAITPMKDTEIKTIPGIGEPVTAGEMNVFQLIQNLQQASTPQQAGNASSPEGGTVSATQVLAQQQDAIRLMGLFGYTIAFLIEDITSLWLQIALQFEFSPEVKENNQLVYKNFFLKDRQVFDNKRRGVLEIRLSPIEQFPNVEQVYKEEEQFTKQTGEVKMIRYVDPEMVRDYGLIVKVQANPNPRASKALDRAIESEFFKTFLNDPYFNQEQLRRGLVELFDKDPEDYINTKNQMEENQMQQMAQGQPQPNNKVNSQIKAGMQPSLKQLVNG
jgi:hypothetical protein